MLFFFLRMRQPPRSTPGRTLFPTRRSSDLYPDMVSLFAGTVLNQTGQAIETIAMTMSVYLIISLTISLLMNIYNRRIAIVER